MKFGKQLQGTMVAEWSDYYVDYKTLKKEIKAISSTDASPPAQVERFVELLVEQLEGVNMFFTTEQASVVAKWKTIDVLMIQAPTAADKAMMIQWLRERLRSNSDSRGEKGSDTTLPTGRMAAKLKASMHQLSLFCDVYDAAQRLSQYVAINYVAFVKGMKKFEKRTALSVGHIFMPRLQRAVFFNSPALAILLAEVDFSAKDLLLRLGCGGAEADMLDEFRCSLCHELMRQPIVLACSHRFCWQCTAQASAVASTEGEWCCPTCRRPQVLSPELYCVATSLSTLVERHMPSGANTRDGNLMEARKASMAAAACSSAASSEPAQAISYFATAVASPAIDRYQQRHTASPRQLDGAEALLSAASDITIGTMPDASALPASVQLQGYDGAMPARFSGAIATHGQDVAAAEEPTMAVAIAVDPSNSIIASTKELSYYDDLVALADVELPTWPFDLHDSDLTDMLPEIETHDQPHLDQITFHPLVPQGVELLSATATQLQLGNSAVLPDAHSAGMQAAAPIGPASRAEAMIKPKEPGHKRKTSSTHTGAGAANAAGGMEKRARSPKETLTEEELREKRMVAQRDYRQRMGRASELRKELEALRKDLGDSQSKLYGYGQQLSSMLTVRNWPLELLQVLPTQVLAPGEPSPTAHRAAIAAATGAVMSSASQAPVPNGAATPRPERLTAVSTSGGDERAAAAHAGPDTRPAPH